MGSLSDPPWFGQNTTGRVAGDPATPWEAVVSAGRPGLQTEERDRSTILIHYYRAMVGRADVWRMRMDATTNWAIGATAAVVSFALGSVTTPHYVIFIAALLTASFLFLEARRLSFYHLWQQRALLIEKGLIRPALRGGAADPAAFDDARAERIDLEAELDPHLGYTIPTMPIGKAAARRLRRIYLYLFAVQLFAWLLKLSIGPAGVGSFGDLVSQARIGAVPGAVVFGLVAVVFGATIAIAVMRGGVARHDPPAID